MTRIKPKKERNIYYFYCVTILYKKIKIKMNVYELINKLQNALNKLVNKNDLSVKTTELLNELFETLKIIENCTSCKDKKIDGNDLDKIEKCLAESEKEYIIDE